MRVEGRRYRDEWLPNFYPSRLVGDRYVRISRTGKTQILTAEEDSQINEIFMDEALYERLENTGHIITSHNALDVLRKLKIWESDTYSGPRLHLVVATKRCNLNCTYCHMNPEPTGSPKEQFDLQPEVADAIIRFALGSPAAMLKFEFQGGEPFLNFKGMAYFVEEARRQNKAVGKDISFTVVSNLMIATDDQLAYCRDNGISVSYTVNGPMDIHDQFRIARNGAGSFETVMKRIDQINNKFPKLLSSSPLCVVTKDNAKHLRRTIEFFHSIGFNGLAILKLNNLGNAMRGGLKFDVREFLTYYIDALDYMYEKNKALRDVYSERSVRVALAKIISDSDVGYVDWRNPIGDVSGAITYDYDGELLPADEARSLRHEFSLGNVLNTSYSELMKRKETFRTMNLSLRDRDPQCRECAYNPYCGVSPVLEYAKTGNPNTRPYESDDCLFVMAVLDWVFKKLYEDPLPIMRMLPSLDAHMLSMVDRQEEMAAETAPAAYA